VYLTNSVPPGGQYTFNFTLTAPAAATAVTTTWRMVHEALAFFGETASSLVQVDCGGPQYDYSCDALVHDGYGRPLVGKRVTLQAWSNYTGTGGASAYAEGITDDQGRVLLGFDPGSDPYYLQCAVDLASLGSGVLGDYKQIAGSGPYVPLPKPTRMTLTVAAVPVPTVSMPLYGLNGGDSATASLYQSRSYDKVVVIPEPFNSDEQASGILGPEGLWREMSALAPLLYSQGYDVWLVSTQTGKNIHEQAAELAQAIRLAAVDYPAQQGSGGFGGKVAVLGISLGGLVTREATARWQGDADWRTQLGLPATLPVSLVYFEDAPLRGAQVNYDLQDFVHEPVPLVHMDSQGNFNSCAFQQIVRVSKLADAAGRGEGGNFSAFFDLGQEIRFYGPGVCDMRSGTHCVCVPGPAISTINGDGFAHAPGLRTVAHSFGALDEPNTCYGNEWDKDAGNVNMCPHAPELPWVPQVGDSASTVAFVGPIPDRELRFRAEDLVPGSRQAGDLATVVGSFDWLLNIEQHGTGTFMPTWSTFGVEGNSHACAVDECVASAHNAAHEKGGPEAAALLLQELGQSLGGSTSNAALTSAGKAQPASVSRADAQAGTSTVAAKAVGADGNGQTLLVQAPIGSGANAAPTVAVGGPYTIGVGRPLTLAATASNPDGRIMRTFWNFADGTFGEGTQATHTYSEAGTYTVFFSATDQRGVSTVVTTTVTVE